MDGWTRTRTRVRKGSDDGRYAPGQKKDFLVTKAGFEPAHEIILELESSALDHSATSPIKKIVDGGEIRTLALKEQWISSPSP